MKVIEQLPEYVLIALSDDSYRAVRLIGHPPYEGQAARLALR